MEQRLAKCQLVILVGFGLLLLRLADLQLVRGAHYRRLAEQNRLRLVPEMAPRGLIVDRQGRILADNETTFRVALVPQELENFPAVVAHLSQVVHRPMEALRQTFAHERTFAFMPAAIVSRVPKDVAIRLEEDRWKFPGLMVRSDITRRYPLGSRAAHLLGYLSQPTAEELPLLKLYGVRPKQLVGRMGVEQILDHALRGQSGGVMVEVDHRARQVRVLGRRDPQPGARVTLTIDEPLQSLIEQAFGDQAGAAVVLDPQSGDVLAMVSVPAFSPSTFIAPDMSGLRQRLFDDPRSPVMNRATVGYQPGSILKLVTAAAALEANVITPATTIVCPGSLTIGDRTFHCWNRDGHGPMRLHEALMQSCNIYFMQVGRRLGAKRLLAALEQAGSSRTTGWPLEEQVGHLPQRRLTEGELALLSIGQGEVLITPLQAARVASALANGGWLVEPKVIQMVAGRPVGRRATRSRIGWSDETLEAVRGGMRAVVSDLNGTGHRAFSEVVSVAGKTGTAQTNIPGQTHGWFLGFCPVDQPRVAMALVAEHGGSGGDLPAEIARSICEYVAAQDAL